MPTCYSSRKNIHSTTISLARLCISQIIHSTNLSATNICILPRQTGIISLALQPNKTSFTPWHTMTGKGIAYLRPFHYLWPIEIEIENNWCCVEVHNSSDSTARFLHGQELGYFDVRSKGLVQLNNAKHFAIDQYMHDRATH